MNHPSTPVQLAELRRIHAELGYPFPLPADAIASDLDRLADAVTEIAKDPANPLHSYFERDEAEAARKQRGLKADRIMRDLQSRGIPLSKLFFPGRN